MDWIRLGLSLGIAGTLLTGCDQVDATGTCGAELGAKVNALQDAADALAMNGDEVATNVLAACEAIITDLDGDVPARNMEEDEADHIRAVCTVASEAITAQVEAGVTITLVAQPPRCTIDASAQLECEASCDVSGMCDPGSVETRCEPGELSVRCEGMCAAMAYCEADASATVTCDGVCQGACEGQCMGSTNAAGECDGTCMGECRGTCQVTADGGVDCGAMARCRGECTGTATAPQCRTELMAPECDIEADCQAGCESQAEFNAECEPGQLALDIQGNGHAMLATTLENNLPILLAVRDGVAAYFDSAEAVASAGARVADEVADTAACAAVATTQLAGSLAAAATATANVSVSVEMSVSVSASASAS